MLPGTLCDGALWEHQRAHLGDVACLRPCDLTRYTTVARAAAGVLAGAPPTFALAGFSMGAVVALEVVRRAPERVSRLALLAANARGSTPENVAAWARWEALARAGRLAEVLGALSAWLHPVRREALAGTVRAMGERVGKEAFLRQLELLRSRVDSRGSLGGVLCPTLLLVGRQDPATPPVLHEEMAELLPNATLNVVEGCGHYSPLERPEAVTAALRGWLGRLDAREPT